MTRLLARLDAMEGVVEMAKVKLREAVSEAAALPVGPSYSERAAKTLLFGINRAINALAQPESSARSHDSERDL